MQNQRLEACQGAHSFLGLHIGQLLDSAEWTHAVTPAADRAWLQFSATLGEKSYFCCYTKTYFCHFVKAAGPQSKLEWQQGQGTGAFIPEI